MAIQGKNAAYRELTAPQDTLSSDIQYWNEDAARRRQEEQENEKIRSARELAAKKERQARVDKYAKPISNYDTGSKSLNEVNGRGLMDAVNQYPELLSILDSEPEGSEKYIKAKIKLENLSKAPENMKAITDKLTARHQKILEGVANGTIKNNQKVNEYLENFKNGFESFQIGYDEMGYPTVMYRDTNGDGIRDAEGYDQIMAGQSAFKFDPNVDITALAKESAGEFGEQINSTDSGYLKETLTGPTGDSMNAMATAKMLGPDGSLSMAGKSYAIDLGLDPDNPNTAKAVVEAFKKEMAPYISKGKTQDFDYSSQRLANKDYLDRQDKLNDKKEADAPAEIEIDTTSDGSPSKTTPPGGGSGDIFSFSPSAPIKAGTKEQPIEITKLFMSKDGKLSFTGKKQVGTESIKEGDVTTKRPVYKDVVGSPINEKELNTLARLINDPATGAPFKNQKELVDHLRSKIDSGEPKLKKTSIKSSEIASRAKASGYTEREYRKLLEEKGITID